MGLLQDQMSKGNQEKGNAEGSGNTDELLKKATKVLYSDNFEAMIDMFTQHGKEGFPDAMAMAVNGTLDRLEADEGPLDQTVAAEVGMGIFEMILEDLAEGGALPDIDKNDVLKSIEMTLAMWAKNHPDQVDQQEMRGIIEQMAAEMARSGQLDSELGVDQEGQPQQVPQQPVQGQPVQGQPVQGQPVQGQPVQGQPVQGV